MKLCSDCQFAKTQEDNAIKRVTTAAEAQGLVVHLGSNPDEEPIYCIRDSKSTAGPHLLSVVDAERALAWLAGRASVGGAKP